MFDALRQFGDRLLGRGSAAITVPVMDGALKPNRALDQARVAATLADIDDLATDGRALFATAGPGLYRLEGEAFVLLRRFDVDLTALAVRAPGSMAVALGGKQVLLLTLAGDTWTDGAHLDGIGAKPLNCVNALRFEADGALVLSDGSTRRGPAQWTHDLMEKGSDGRVARWQPATGQIDLLADGLEYAFGVLPVDGGVLYSQSWRHKVMQASPARASGPAGASTAVLADLPAYPSRMAPATGGGFWLSCFACRTQLVEFVLREDAYRKRMLAEIDPRYWVAPALRSGASFLEPLQGAGVKQMGQLKPWAPPRSYGLVLRVDAQGRTLASLHSQVDGAHHGITALAELGRVLYAASRGSGRLLAMGLDGLGAAT